MRVALDTSAVAAVVFGEPDAEVILGAMRRSEPLYCVRAWLGTTHLTDRSITSASTSMEDSARRVHVPPASCANTSV